MTPSKIGPYPIEREVGRGGMGVVYLGRDTRLDRPVAIKVLPDGLARDPERLARFEREARLLAALSHANIAGIYGLEEENGRRFLALEYVEGETLADRLRRGPLSLEDTLDIGRQIAGALEAAHESGIVHRDLKPGNVKITPGGQVKVLDFGLAKGGASAGDSTSDLSQSPTLTLAATGAGVILGTAAYMSPEQARGKPVDRRTDIWSFGAVLYECLTGAQAFAGETVSDTIALILQGSADWSKLPPGTPEKLRLLLVRCLERDAHGRLRDIGDARIEIEELMGSRVSNASRLATATSTVTAAAPAPGPRWTPLAIGALLLLVGGAIGAAAWNALRPARPEAPFRFTIQAPPRAELANDPNELAISPDGKTLVFGAADSTGRVTLWLRPLGEFEARELPNTKDGSLPFWSPDGRQIGFFADGKLKRCRISDGSVETICDANTGRGASWGKNDVIVFSPGAATPLYQVRASGGTPEAVTAIDSTQRETGHRWPSFLPDGDHFTFAALPIKQGQFTCYIGSVRTKERTLLLSATNAPVYAAPGYVIFARGDALMAQRFDPGPRRVIGDPFRIGDRPAQSTFSGGPGVSVSTQGVMAWQSAGKQDTRLVWLDRSGREISAVDVAPDRWGLARLSPDGRRALITKADIAGQSDVWVLDLERGVSTRLTKNQGVNYIGVWSPDGREILYGSNRGGARNIYRRAADGSGADQMFYESPVPFKDPSAWSPDGQWVIEDEIGDDTGWNLYLIPAAGGERKPFLNGPANEQNGQISSDGRWVVYISDEVGSPQAFVQSFPGLGHKQQVSKSGAWFAEWSGSGREIFLLRSDLSVLSVPVTPGPELRFGAPRELYRLPINSQGWDAAPDGQRFLATIPAQRTVPGISIAVNWRAGHEE